jgi:hypothetical protein
MSISKVILKQMNSPFDANPLTMEQLAVIRSLSDATLRAAGNPAYLKLEKENLVLRDRVDALQFVIR